MTGFTQMTTMTTSRTLRRPAPLPCANPRPSTTHTGCWMLFRAESALVSTTRARAGTPRRLPMSTATWLVGGKTRSHPMMWNHRRRPRPGSCTTRTAILNLPKAPGLHPHEHRFPQTMQRETSRHLKPRWAHTRSSRGDWSTNVIRQEHVSFSKVVLTKFSNPPRYKPKKVKFHQCNVCLKSFPRYVPS